MSQIWESDRRFILNRSKVRILFMGVPQVPPGLGAAAIASPVGLPPSPPSDLAPLLPSPDRFFPCDSSSKNYSPQPSSASVL